MNKWISMLALCLAGAMGAQATLIDWVGLGADTEWNNTNNWETSYVPGNNTNGVIDRADLFAGADIATVTTAVTSSNKVDIMMRNNGNITISADMDSLRNIDIGVNGGTGGFGTFIKQNAGTVNASRLTLGTDDTNGGLYEISGTGTLELLNNTIVGANGKISISGSDASLLVGNGADEDLTVLTTGILEFSFDANGIGTIDVKDDFIVNPSNSVLSIDASAYMGSATQIDLVTFGTNSTQFATSNIVVTTRSNIESWSIGYDADSMFINLVPYGGGDTLLIGEDDNDGNEVYLSRVRSGNRQDVGVTWKRCNRATVQNPDFVDASLYLADGTPTNDASEVRGFLKSTKTDNIFGMYRGGITGGTLTYMFDISGYENLNMEVDLAVTGVYADQGINMAYSIDGGAVVTNLDIGVRSIEWIQIMEDGRSVTNSKRARIDVDGVEVGYITNEFETYKPTITGTGSVLTVTLSMGSVGGNFATGMDNLKLYGDVIPKPGDTLAIGKDNYDDPGKYESRTIVGAANSAGGITWNIVSRDNIQYPGMIDTSVAAGGVVATNSADALGFLGTNKTDKIFGMYRAGATRSLTYSFDITDYEDLNLLVDLATSGAYNGSKDVSMSYSIDGGATNTILDIGLSSDDWTETMDNGTNFLRNQSFPVSVNGVVANSLTDEFQTYNPLIDGTGSNLTLIIVMGSGIGGYGGMGMDNLELIGTLAEPVTPGIDYGTWAASYGLEGAEADESYDYEPDGLDNLMEYATGGNPTNADTVVETYTADDGGTDYFYHIYDQRVDDAALTFTVGATDDLVGTPADATDVSLVGQSDEVDGFRTQTNRTEMTTAAKFISLTVEK